MNEQSAVELEHEAEALRSQVADTAESLKAKLTPGQIIDELTSVFRGSGGTETLSNLKLQVQEHPLPLVLVGTGLAWLMFGKAPGSREQGSETSQSYVYGDWRDTPGQAGDSKSGVAEAAADVTASISDTASSVAAGAADMASSVKEAVSGTADSLKRKGADADRMMRGGVQAILDQDPFVLAALGVALGTAIGAALPATEFEDAQLGSLGDQVRQMGEEGLAAGLDEAKEVAERAFEAGKEEADRQGLMPSEDGPTLSEKLSNVVGSAAAAAQEALRDKDEK
jgi:hypothetical protein